VVGREHCPGFQLGYDLGVEFLCDRYPVRCFQSLSERLRHVRQLVGNALRDL
jgi:hypothetical protein